MSVCKHRVEYKCKKDGRPCIYRPWCAEPEEPKPMTNADRINAMSVKEKSQFLTSVVADGCPPDHDWDCMKDDQGWDGCDAC